MVDSVTMSRCTKKRGYPVFISSSVTGSRVAQPRVEDQVGRETEMAWGFGEGVRVVGHGGRGVQIGVKEGMGVGVCILGLLFSRSF